MVKLQVINFHSFPLDKVTNKEEETGNENLFIYIGRQSSIWQVRWKWSNADVKDYSILGNPFLIRPRVMSARKAVDKYSRYFLEIMSNRDNPLKAEIDNLYVYLSTLRKTNVYFICFCNPRICHGDVIVNYAINYVLNDKKGEGFIWSPKNKTLEWKD